MLKIQDLPKSYCQVGLRFELKDFALPLHWHTVTQEEAENGWFWIRYWGGLDIHGAAGITAYQFNGAVDINSLREIFRRQNAPQSP